MNLKRPLLLFFFLSMPTAAGGAIVAACSSDPEVTGGDVPDGASDTTTTTDARSDAIANDGGGGGKDGGNCSAVKGPCDIVLQDCPDKSGQKQECVVSQESSAGGNGALTTRCVAVQASQTLPAGRACCSNAAGGNPCLPGLTCVGAPCVDGGPVTGRCSPACCEGDDQGCGLSDPEGIAGSCDLTLFDDDTEVHRVCSYRERCKPFKQEACKQGFTCLIEDKLGTAGCITTQDKALGTSCGFANDCADGLFCHSDLPDGGDARCHMICLTPNAVHPFDAGVEDGGPLSGGCNPSQQCNITNFSNLPAWFSLCTLDGG